MPTDPTDPAPSPPPDPRPGPDRPGGTFAAAIQAGGPLADLVAEAGARDDARRQERTRAARDVAGRMADLLPTQETS